MKYAFGGYVKKKFTAKGDPIIDPETGEQYFEPVFDAGLVKTFIEADHPKKFAHVVPLPHRPNRFAAPTAHWPAARSRWLLVVDAKVQLCVVHLVRAGLRYVNVQDSKAVAI
jgi:hypothetical protein